MEHKVNVYFDGVVMVDSPDCLSPEDARLLAEKLVLAMITATTDGDQSGQVLVDAFEEYEDECSVKETAEHDWDATGVSGVCGTWTSKIETPKSNDGKLLQVELGVAFGGDNGSWTTDFVDIPRNTPEKDIEEVAIDQYRTEHPGEEIAHLWLYHYSYDVEEEDNEIN